MTAEPAFLVAAVRRFLHADAPLSEPKNIDWDILLRLASDHAVTPMLYSVLRDVPLPERIATELRSAFETSVQWSMAQSGELAGLAALLAEHEVPFIALKGPLLSRYLYGELTARSSGDIDLLVKPDHVLRIRDLLASRGYRVANTLHWSSDSAYLRSRENEISFESPSGVSIDVHWRILPGYFASPFDGLDVWETSQTVMLAGRQIQTLSPEHLLILICSHSAKHAFERLGWICDISRFLIVTPNLNWSAIVNQAERTRTLRQLSIGVALAADVLGAPRPRQLTEDPAVTNLAHSVQDRLFAGNARRVSALELTRFCVELLDNGPHRFRFLTGHYLTPSEAEYKVLSLPPSLYFLYYPYRPVRLFAKHVLRRVIRS